MTTTQEATSAVATAAIATAEQAGLGWRRHSDQDGTDYGNGQHHPNYISLHQKILQTTLGKYYQGDSNGACCAFTIPIDEPLKRPLGVSASRPNISEQENLLD
jgi:hypothetical protein